MKFNKQHHFKTIRQQDGIVLFVALAFLFVSTLLGVTSLRSNFFNEKMTLNSIQREQALEAAEVALLEGERFVEAYTNDILATVISGTGSSRVATSQAQTCSVVIDGEGGVCTPKEASGDPDDQYDNWIEVAGDSNSLGVWSNSSRHRSISDTIKNRYNLATNPSYIIEFMGYVVEQDGVSACADFLSDGSPNSNADPDQLTAWPYCDDDNAQFRITAIATSGNYGETRVMLQSTYVVDI